VCRTRSAGKGLSAPDDVTAAHLSVRENSALSAAGSRDSPLLFTGSRDSIGQRGGGSTEGSENDRTLRTTATATATGSDVISFDALPPLHPLPEIDLPARQPEVKFIQGSIIRHRLSSDERLIQTRRTVTSLVLLSIESTSGL